MLGFAPISSTPISALPVAGGGTQVSLGTVTETDAPVALSRVKTRTLGTATETDTPVGISRKKARTLGVATETDTAVPLLVPHIIAVGTATAIPVLVGTSSTATPTGSVSTTR